MTIETRKSFCRICTAYCGIEVDVDIDECKAVAIRGDVSDPMSGGYTCIKGRQLDYQQAGPHRLRGSLERNPAGGFDAIASDAAIEKIGEKLREIVDRYGARAVATYGGTAAYSNAGVMPLVRAWHRGFGSTSNYSTLTIDQPSKIIAVARHGVWAAGPHTFSSADVIMTIGNNPIVSGLTLPGGPPGTNPVKTLEDAMRRGMRVICIDPRRSELARRATLHLQLRPGEDATLLAGILRVILDEGLHDADFCNDHVEGFDDLVAAIAPYTPEYVERRCEIPRDQLLEAARLFAEGPRGYVSSGTGPDMGPHPALSQHLICCVNAVCGRFIREGETIPNPGVFMPPIPRPAQAIAPELLPPSLKFGEGPKARFRGLSQMFEEMPTTTLAEEILEPGEGQIRALICVGGNPAVAVPNAAKMVEALDDLELLVGIDISLTETCKRADYVIAARHSLEREDVTDFMDMFYEVPYAYYTRAAVEPDCDVVDDWHPFVRWAKQLDGKIELPGGEVPLDRPLSKLELLELIYPQTRVPVATLRESQVGKIYDDNAAVATPPIPGLEARLRLTPDGITTELAEVFGEDFEAERADRFSHLLICRRLKMVSNSIGHDFPLSQKKAASNAAFMNPKDLADLGLEAGDLIEIESELSNIDGVVAPSDEVKPGVISMSHCWGRGDGEGDVRKEGANTARLIAVDRDYDPISGMARMTAVRVAVRRAAIQ
jgi:anaerobic selenocysteine-containing dehydrogenase